MAEAAAVPLAIASTQGGWFVVQQLRRRRPRFRLQKWEGKVAEAMEKVKTTSSGIKQGDMEFLLERYANWEQIANDFRADLENRQMGFWKAWFGQNHVWTAAKRFELLAKKTSSAGILYELKCQAFHTVRTDPAERCHICADQPIILASNTPGSITNAGPQQQPIINIPVTCDTTHMTSVSVNVHVYPSHSGAQLEGVYMPRVNVSVIPIATKDVGPSSSHGDILPSEPTPPAVQDT